jgi:hypothetical protein
MGIKIKDLIEILKTYNQEAEFDVEGESEFMFIYSGPKDIKKHTKKTATKISLAKTSLLYNDNEIKDGEEIN